MGNTISKKKHVDKDNNVFYTSDSLNGYNVHKAYDFITHEYSEYKVFLISNKSTKSFVSIGKTIFIFYGYDDNLVKLIEIYN